MALANIQSTDVRFRVTFDLGTSPKVLSVTDLVQNGYDNFQDTSKEDFKAILKVTSPSGSILYINDEWGADSFAVPDIELGDWTQGDIELELDQYGRALTGYYTIELKVSIDGGSSLEFNISKVVSLDYVPFSTSSEITFDYPASTITSEDTTDYSITIKSVVYENQTNLSLNRTHTIQKPAGAQCVVPAATSGATRVFGGGGTPETDLWTGAWAVDIRTNVSYNLETWGADVSVIVNDTVVGGGSSSAQHSECMCAARQCIVNLTNRYKDALLSGSLSVVNQLREKVIKVSLAWMNLEIAERCGEDVQPYCSEIISITSGENCDCSSVSSGSQHIIPVTYSDNSGSGTSGSVIAYGSGDPVGGTPGDFYFKIPGYNLYANVANSWVDLGSFQGATGAPSTEAGPTGPTGPAVTGPTGPPSTLPGQTGPAGIDGANPSITYSASIPTGGVNGDYHFVVPGYILYTKTGGAWVSLGSFKGSTGDPGDKGDTGDGYTGPSGPDGATGPTGIGVTGAKGDKGDTGYVVSLSIRYGDTSPSGQDIAPQALGQVYIKTTTKDIWMAGGLTKTDWVPLS